MIVENDNSISNLDRKGKKVVGWKYEKTNKIIKELEHFKKGDKDYLIKLSQKEVELLAINGSSRLKYNSSNTINTNNDNIIDVNNNLLFVNKSNKLLICNLDGSSSEIELEFLDTNSSLGYHKQTNQLLISNKNELLFLDKDFNKNNSIVFNDNITQIKTYQDYIIVVTKNEIILLKDNAIVKGTPLQYDGTYKIVKLSNNNKINILLTRNKVLYNFELE